MYEIRELQVPYWFTNDEVARIQELNLEYMGQKDLAEMVKVCFQKPKDGESFRRMNSTEILKVICREYPSVHNTVSTRVSIGLAMKELGFERTECSHVKYYRVVPLKSA